MRQERELDLREILLYLWQHIVIIVFCMLLGIIGGIGVTLFGTRNNLPYVASALIYFDTSDRNNFDGSNQFAYYGNITTLSNVVVTSKQLLDKVIDSLELETDVVELTKRISVETVGSSSFMRLTVSGQEAEIAKDTCNEILAIMPDVSTSMTNLGVLQAASQAEIAVVAKPGLVKASVVGGFLGIILSVLVLVALELFDHSIYDVEDVEYYLGMKTLGVIPVSSRKDNMNLTEEAYRSLYINLEGGSCRRTSVLLVTEISASNPGTQVAEKLSETFIQMGKKVVLVDADLHRGSISKHLGLQDKDGVSEFLQKTAPLEMLLQYEETIGCTVVPCGKFVQDSAKQLSSAETQKLFKELRERFDVIVVYTGAITLTSDAAVLSCVADKVLLVASIGKTPVECGLLAKEKMEFVKAPVSGVVLTDYNYKKARRRDGYFYVFSAGKGK